MTWTVTVSLVLLAVDILALAAFTAYVMALGRQVDEQVETVDVLTGRVDDLAVEVSMLRDDRDATGPIPAIGPPTAPAGAVIDTGHAQLIAREMGGHTFQFRTPQENT